VALLAWVHTFWAYGYTERFSMRAPLLEATAFRDPPPSVVCYPRRWDSVSFYLQRDDVIAFPPERRAEMIEFLTAHPGALLVVKTTHIEEVQRDLPPGLVFGAAHHWGTAVGRVVPWPESPSQQPAH
jgi:hypothetical protein